MKQKFGMIAFIAMALAATHGMSAAPFSSSIGDERPKKRRHHFQYPAFIPNPERDLAPKKNKRANRRRAAKAGAR